MQISIEQIIMGNCIKYERLTPLIMDAFKNIDANEVDIFVDLWSVLKPIYSKDVDINNSPKTSITSCVINLCAHYRRFLSRAGVRTRFYLLYSNNFPDTSSLICKGYQKDFAAKVKVNPEKAELIDRNCMMLESICPYLPDIMFIRFDEFDIGGMMFYIMSNKKVSECPNIVISKDIVQKQLAAVAKDTIVLRPKKQSGNDVSYYVSKDNLVEGYIRERNINVKNFKNNINPELYSFLLACTRCNERSLKSILAIPKAFLIISSLITNNLIYNGYNYDVSQILNVMGEKTMMTLYHAGVEQRWKVLDAIFQATVFSQSPQVNMIGDFQNLYNPRDLHALCNEYFQDNPLDLDSL